MTSDGPPLSVVVPTRDRPEQLDACLSALVPALRPVDELLVVDSASRDRRVPAVAQAHGVAVVRCDEPGASRARNAGVDAARHEVVAFVDDDVRVAPGWAAALAAPFADPGVAFVAGRIGVPPEQAGYQRPVAINDAEEPERLDASSRRALGSSANLAIRRSAFTAVAGFDESMGGGARFEAAEDLDLYDRLFAAGFTGCFEPAARAWHDQWRTRRQLLVLDWRYGLGTGARLAKLARRDRRRARHVVRTVVVANDLGGLWRAIRRWEEFAAATTAVRILGTLVGLVRALPVPVREGHFAPRHPR
jgi:glycosyltransferase involved in cell wall biosynthesis